MEQLRQGRALLYLDLLWRLNPLSADILYRYLYLKPLIDKLFPLPLFGGDQLLHCLHDPQ